MIKISTYIYIKKVCHYNKWRLKINLFTKVFMVITVPIFVVLWLARLYVQIFVVISHNTINILEIF